MNLIYFVVLFFLFFEEGEGRRERVFDFLCEGFLTSGSLFLSLFILIVFGVSLFAVFFLLCVLFVLSLF